MIYSDYVVRQVRLIAWFYYLILVPLKIIIKYFCPLALGGCQKAVKADPVSENAFRTQAWEEVIFICDWNDDAF